MELDRLLEDLRKGKENRLCIKHVEEIPSRSPSMLPLPEGLHPRLLASLQKQGIASLYPHQEKALRLLQEGRNVVVAAGTAGGKSLCYHLPVLDTLLKQPGARALYLFPTKALAQDQLRSLYSFGLEGMAFGTYDGDTPVDMRKWLRRRGRVILSNPDMLHLGILPNHRIWGDLLQGLRFVVVDEAHALRGVFGSHVAMVLRRLRRACGRYGSSPRFILTSATIGNPLEHAQALTGLEVEAVLEDQSPRGRKAFILWNPPLETGKGEESERRNSLAETTRLLRFLLTREVRTIAFSRSRAAAEKVFAGVRRGLERTGRGELAGRVAPYRGGYLAEERREIERRLFSGELLGVSCTNALELGIDIGELEACIINGYPGTLSSLWQQAGRAGRRRGESLAVLVARDDPLDQYLARNPDAVFQRPVEEAVIDLENPNILDAHLLCASFEFPLDEGDAALFGPAAPARLKKLAEAGRLRLVRRRYASGTESPAAAVSLRSASSRAYRIIEAGTGSLLGTVDEGRAFFDVHPGAVYLHRGDSYEVKELDLQRRVALVEETEEEFLTQPRDHTEIRVVEELASFPSRVRGGCSSHFGKVEVVTKVYAYQKRSLRRRSMVETVDLDLPPLKMNTTALWYAFPAERLKPLQLDEYLLAGGLHALEHAAIAMLPLFAMCDRWDVGGVSTAYHRDAGHAAVFIYDGFEGGAGIARKGFDRARSHLERTASLLATCPCERGCPSCIHSPKCGNGNEPLDKRAAGMLLGLLLKDL
jgi:DEAD/DEAH box helicase domain-containing protein